MNEPQIEWINDRDISLALIVRTGFTPTATTFLTPSEYEEQLGYIVYPSGTKTLRHTHKSCVRTIQTTPEFIFVKKGRTEVCFYNSDQKEICCRFLNQGDLVLIFHCGHQFKFLEDTILIEVKQGPYPGPSEKESF